MPAPVVLVEATPRNGATAAPVTIRLAGGGAVVPYRYGGQDWRAGLSALPKSVATLDFDEGELGGGGVTQAMQLSWSPATNAKLAEVAALYWADAAVTVRIGPEDGTFALPPIVTTGLVLEAPIAEGALTIALADTIMDLKRPLLIDRYAGSGDLEGSTEWAGRIKPRSWGRCFNVGGRVIDTAYNIWNFGDPARPWQAFDKVRDSGVDAAAIVVLAWQGSIAATLAALRAAVVPEGGCVACPSLACVRWWTVPAGDLKADIRGEIDGGYVETAPQIAQRIVAARSTLAFAAGAITAATAARPMPFGWRVDNDNASAADQVSSVLADVSLSWILVDGAIVFRPWEWFASTRSARSQSVARRGLIAPVKGRKLGYRKNWSQMARGDLAALVFAQDVVYETGTSVADAIETAQTTADGKNKLFYAPAPPLAAVSAENDRWQDTANGNREYQRLAGSGALSMGGTTVTFGGTRIIYRPWTPRRDAGIDSAIASAAIADGKAVTAQAAATAAQATAGTAIGKLVNLADDSILSIDEKIKQLIPEDAKLEGAWAVLDTQAATFMITTERTAAAAARTAWQAYRNALSPAWNNITVDTTGLVRATYRSKLLDYDTSLVTLYKAFSAKAATVANWSGLANDNGFLPENSADVTQLTTGPAAASLARSYDGTVKSGELPRDFAFKTTRGGADVSSTATWSAAAVGGSGTATCSISGGILTVTAASDGVVILVTSTVGTKVTKAQITLGSTIDPPPTGGGGGGGGGSTGSTSTIAGSTGNTYGSANTSVLQAVAGSGGKVDLTFPGRFKRTTNGTANAAGKWQWRMLMGTFADVAAEIVSTSGAEKAAGRGGAEPEPAVNQAGQIAVTMTKTGLAAGMTYEFQLLLRADVNVPLTWTGTATAVGG